MKRDPSVASVSAITKVIARLILQRYLEARAVARGFGRRGHCACQGTTWVGGADAVDQDPEQPRLQRRWGLEPLDPFDDADPRLPDLLLGDRVVVDHGPGQPAHGHLVLLH